MNRTSLYKALYLLVIISLVGLWCWVAIVNRFPPVTWIVVAIVLLIPGRIVGFLWRDFFRGRVFFDSRQFAEALTCYQRFLERLHKQPWMKSLIWGLWGFYTRNIEAMTHNNIGVCHLELGQLDAAEQAFKQAASLDPLFPMPPYNLALIRLLSGDEGEARRLFDEAVQKGYRGTTFDQWVSAAASQYAKMMAKHGTQTTTRL